MSRLAPIRELSRLRCYQRSIGARQTAKLYAAMAARRESIRLSVPGAAHPVVCRPTDADRFTLCHVFIERDAEVPVAIEPKLIVDGGANVGYVSIYYANRYPDAEIVGIEPDEGNFAVAVENCAPYPQVTLLRAGLWPRDAPLEVRDPPSGHWMSWGRMSWGRMSWGRQTFEAQAASETVEGISVPTLLKRIGRDRIDILKLDLERAEEPLFSDAYREWLPNVRTVLVETHGEASERAVAGAMDECGFELVRGGHRLVFVNLNTPPLHPESDGRDRARRDRRRLDHLC